MNNYYFDNAATSWPKPESVYKSAENQMRNMFGNPGRSGHTRTLDADRLLYKTREALAKLFNVKDPARIVFTLNATDSLNIALKGFLTKGSHVINTAMDHNSVLRPLGRLIKDGIITTSTIPCSKTGVPDLGVLESSYIPETKLLIINHASNVTGTIAPLEDMISSAHRHNVKVLVDAAQTAGTRNINVEETGIDMLAFTGHKGLLGPTGTGGLYVKPGIDLKPLREGGTGSQSELDIHPESMPERLEAGTMNSSGLAGLSEGVNYILETGIDNIINHEHQLREYLLKKIIDLPGVNIFGPSAEDESSCIISITIDNADCGEIGYILESNYKILCRTGLHCAPLAHKAIGTFPEGTIRFSPGVFTQNENIDYLVDALKEILNMINN
ncbi:MAG: aminotransferase class V-fold PLP-dependent enzyme [Bacillota bacterium]|nr:aminotransferase class V-fold PLP-dependent enzyme [Bacillota bacterium]